MQNQCSIRAKCLDRHLELRRCRVAYTLTLGRLHMTTGHPRVHDLLQTDPVLQ